MELDNIAENVFEILPWDDVLFKHVLNRLSLKDQFRLRAVSRLTHEMMKEFFAQNQTLIVTPLDGNFTKEAFKTVTENSKLLKGMSIHNAKDFLDDELLVPVISDNIWFEKLNLNNCKELTNRSLCMLGMHCESLSILMMDNCTWMDKDNFMLLVSNNPNLYHLDIPNCVEVDDECIELLGRSCRKMRFLSLSGLYINDSSIVSMAKNLLKLSWLSIESCWRLTDIAVNALGEYCKELSFLYCKECPNITEASLLKLRLSGVCIDVSPDIYYLESLEFIPVRGGLIPWVNPNV